MYYIELINKLSRKNEKPTKGKVRRIPALAGDGGEGGACVEDQGRSSSKNIVSQEI